MNESVGAGNLLTCWFIAGLEAAGADASGGWMGEIFIRFVSGRDAEGKGGRLWSDRKISAKAIAFTPTHSETKAASPENRSQRGSRLSSFMRDETSRTLSNYAVFRSV